MPRPRAGLWAKCTPKTTGFPKAYNEVYTILLETARLRNQGGFLKGSKEAQEAERVASEVAAVVLFWRKVFEEDAQYEEFPRNSHAYPPHHASIVIVACRKGVTHGDEEAVYVPCITSDLLPTIEEIKTIRGSKAAQFTTCQWLFLQRVNFYHTVTRHDRADPELFKILGTRDRVDDDA